MTYNFKNNKYTKWYWNIIHQRQNNVPETKYTEKHHIIPKSLGGPNTKDNLVELTAREHFIVHLLLVRMVNDLDVYKMVHAMIRFTKKIKTSHEYELLRTTVSRYSTGKYNHSYGKIWVHDKVTKEIFYIKKDDFCSDTMIRGLPYQRGGHKNYKTINNGKKESMIPKHKNIPEGWHLGRLIKPDIAHMKKMAKRRHTPEKDEEHRQKLIGRIGIYNLKNNEYKKVYKHELEHYKTLGFIVGSPPKYAPRGKSVIFQGKTYLSIRRAAKDNNVTENYIRKHGKFL